MRLGIDPRLNADVLCALRAMDRGDFIAVTDTNFPAERIASETVTGMFLRMEFIMSTEAVETILSVMPLDTFVNDFAGGMKVIGEPDMLPQFRRMSRPALRLAGESRALC